MSKDTSNARIALGRADCKTMAQGLRVFARQLTEDCRRTRKGQAVPQEVTAQAGRLAGLAGQLDGMQGMDCSLEGWILADDQGQEHNAFAVTPTDWQAVAAVLGFLSDRLQRVGDKDNAARLADLSEKAKGIGGWCVDFLGLFHGLRRDALEYGQDGASRPRP